MSNPIPAFLDLLSAAGGGGRTADVTCASEAGLQLLRKGLLRFFRRASACSVEQQRIMISSVTQADNHHGLL